MKIKTAITATAVILAIGVIVMVTAGKETETVTRQIATFETTMGTFKIELYNDLAPKTVENFTKLIDKGFYNERIFHRVIENFMIQGGCPDGTGPGGMGRSELTGKAPTVGRAGAAHFRASAGPAVRG